jgi:hypothetical protein
MKAQATMRMMTHAGWKLERSMRFISGARG